MPSVDSVCPACKMPVANHLPSSRHPPAEVPPGMVAVVNGRCTPSAEGGHRRSARGFC